MLISLRTPHGNKTVCAKWLLGPFISFIADREIYHHHLKVVKNRLEACGENERKNM